MDDAHTFTEDQVMKELHRSLKASLKDAKAKGLLGNDDLTGEETQLVIYGLALFLYSAAVEVKSASPVMLLPWSQSEDKRQTPLDATTCPPQFLPFFNRWAAIVPRIRSLSEDHSLDLGRIICKKTPVTLPTELPDPFPFSPTPEVKILATLHGISADLRTIALGIYDHRSFQAQHTEDVREELMTSIEDIEEAIGVNMPASEILTRLARHGYQDISDDLDLAACMGRPSGRAPNGDTYSGRFHDGTKIMIKTIPVQAVIQDGRKRSRLRHMARELHAWSKCQHPNITRLLGLAEFKGQIAALSLSMDNGNLLAYVQKTPNANRLDLATQVAAGLAYLHFIGVVHCDLKGANVLVSNDGTATLINISGVVVQDLISDPKTTMEGFSLSPRWMAPEMLEGRSASAEADVYALGMTILETMSGALPYAGEVDRHVISATLWGRLPPRPIKNIPSDVEWGNRLWSMLLKCWVRDPQRRLTAGEVYDTMRGIAQFCYKSKAIFVPGTHAQILGTTISSVMSPSEIVAQLGCRGCPDMSDLLDLSSCSNHPISRGGFGDVYRGKLRNGIQVALKTMVVMAGTSHEEEKQLKHTALELYTWAQCEHQNVVKLLGLATFRDQITMLSPWMDNGDLRTYISKNPQADRTILCAQTARGLAYLHNKGIVHGDVKGANVLVSNEGVAMLTDFGNAVLKTATLQFTSTTTKNHISVRWTAPEMLEGGGYTTQADIYALGMTILETISGRVPYYDKQHDHAVMHSVMIMKQLPKRPEDHIPSNSSDGNILWSLLLRCWSYERTGRPNAGDVFKMMKTITRKGLLPRT